jgi:hypothetical protein
MIKFRITASTIASLICLATLSSSAATQGSFERARIPDVELCDLLKSPSRYKNRIVRLRAVYSSWFEGSELVSDCDNDEGSVWAHFPDSVFTRSKPEIAEKLEDVFFRYLPSASAESDQSFNNFQTELTITGKILQSKKKTFGIHGGFAYLFTITTVEKIGTTHIHDLVTGKTTVHISETSKQRQARHAQDEAMVCESNSHALDKVLTEFESPDEEITLVARLGQGERSRDLNQLRLATVRDYFINCAGVSGNRLILREGARTDLEGRVSIYRAGKVSETLLAGTRMNLCLKPCAALLKKGPPRLGRVRNRVRKNPPS